MRELWHECEGIFRHGFVAVIGLTIATAAGGALISPLGQSAGGRVAAASIGAAIGLAAVALMVFVIALVRVPLREYRKRHGEQRLGQECVDGGRAIVRCFSVIGFTITEGAALSGDYDPKSGDEALKRLEALTDAEFARVEHEYEHRCARRVYRCATDLFESDHIDRDERDAIRSIPITRADGSESRKKAATEMLHVAERLMHFGMRLGGKL